MNEHKLKIVTLINDFFNLSVDQCNTMNEIWIEIWEHYKALDPKDKKIIPNSRIGKFHKYFVVNQSLKQSLQDDLNALFESFFDPSSEDAEVIALRERLTGTVPA